MVDYKLLRIDERREDALQLIQKLLSEGWVLHPQLKIVRTDTFVIYHFVKYSNEELAEVESPPEEQIVSVKTVDLNDVDDLLAEGYMVRALYAKNAVLVKKEMKDSA